MYPADESSTGELSLRLGVHFPESYPSASCPVAELQAPWLSENSRRRVADMFADLYAESVGEVVVFRWVEWLKVLINSFRVFSRFSFCIIRREDLGKLFFMIHFVVLLKENCLVLVFSCSISFVNRNRTGYGRKPGVGCGSMLLLLFIFQVLTLRFSRFWANNDEVHALTSPSSGICRSERHIYSVHGLSCVRLMLFFSLS